MNSQFPGELYRPPLASSDTCRESAHVGDNGPKRKSKKANSEVRKQQNRIASRNYREKRKQKLHQLQRLIKDVSNEYQQPPASPIRPEACIAPSAKTYNATAEPIVPSHQSISEDNHRSESSSSIAFPTSTMSSQAVTFSSPLYPSTQLHFTFGPEWSAPLYSPPPPPDIQWNLPSVPPGPDQPPRLRHHVDAYDLTQVPIRPLFDSSNLVCQPLQPPPDSLDPNFAPLEHCSVFWDAQTQSSGPPNESMPTSSFLSYYEPDERLCRPY
ncbi:hypothetical protein J1614_010160 [Plenodomus biglobosus]|nr:hypothetical protein J1614_010160 [Plenodomus biglobosus]